MKRLALIYGGKSAEREVSISGAESVENALDKNKYKVRKYDAATDLPKLVEDAGEIDCAFILLHGRLGEDGTMQGFLDLLGIPYQSSGVLGSALAMDKHLSKLLFRENGLHTPRWWYIHRGSIPHLREIIHSLGLPLIVKPCNQGSSVGIGIARDDRSLEKLMQSSFEWDDDIIVEHFIKGREITVGVMGLDTLEAFPVVEIIPGEKFEFFDYEAKYKQGATKEICPAEISEELSNKAKDIAIRAHRALKLSIYSRTDMIIAPDDEIYVIETNTIPGMTPTSLFPQAAKAYGLEFPKLLDRLIELAMERGCPG